MRLLAVCRQVGPCRNRGGASSSSLLVPVMGPHDNRPVLHAGAPLDSATAAMLMIHGRGASPKDILGLAPVLDRPRFACVAPSAAGGTWYPYRFMAPRGRNEPGLDRALWALEALARVLLRPGFPSH